MNKPRVVHVGCISESTGCDFIFVMPASTWVTPELPITFKYPGTDIVLQRCNPKNLPPLLHGGGDAFKARQFKLLHQIRLIEPKEWRLCHASITHFHQRHLLQSEAGKKKV